MSVLISKLFENLIHINKANYIQINIFYFLIWYIFYSSKLICFRGQSQDDYFEENTSNVNASYVYDSLQTESGKINIVFIIKSLSLWSRRTTQRKM